jgi:hypothetical protein
MHQTSIYPRLAALAAVTTALLGSGFTPTARAGDFPPLNNPATVESHTGKFVWAELFTTDPASAAKFYSGLFGWTAITVEQHGTAYTVLSNGNHPIAGLRQRDSSAAPHAARWINYIAVADIGAALAAVAKAGGVVRAPARDFPELGSLAIITDGDHAPVGLIQSSSGDSPDREPGLGEWNWFHLFVRNPQAAADFYRQVLNYDVTPDSRLGRKTELLLATGDFNRGGISPLPDRADAKPGWLGVIRVTDIDDLVGRVPALGGEVIVVPHAAALGSRFALIADPTGGTVGVVEYVNNANPVNHP